jgi:uncharacterized membrane protein YhfC
MLAYIGLCRNQGDGMVSTLDIFGLAIGMIYTICAPIVGYFLLRTFAPLRVRDIALGVFGFFVILVVSRTLVGQVAFFIAELVQTKGHLQSIFSTLFLFDFFFHGAFSLLNETACFLLLKYFAPRRQGYGPGIAYGIGAGSVICLVFANTELGSLRLASTINEYGLEAALGQGVRVSSNFLTDAFAHGIPTGVGAVSSLLIEIVLASLVWRGILEGKGKWILIAILLDMSLAAALSLLSALAVTFSLPIPVTAYPSLFGLVLALSYFWAPPFLRWKATLARLRQDRIVVNDDGSVHRGLLSTWRDQQRRSD